MIKFVTALVLAASAFSAQADVIQADFTAASDLPYCCARSGPKVLQELNKSVGAGNEIGAATAISNPSSWGGGVVYVDLDGSTGVLTLDSQDAWDFQTFVVTINDMQFSTSQILVGVTMLSNDLTTLGIVPSIVFGDNSLTISYDTQSIFNFTNNNATFQLLFRDTGTAVPEPASLALFGLALFGLGAARRRKA